MRDFVAILLPAGEQTTNWVPTGTRIGEWEHSSTQWRYQTNQVAGSTVKVDGVAATEEVE